MTASASSMIRTVITSSFARISMVGPSANFLPKLRSTEHAHSLTTRRTSSTMTIAARGSAIEWMRAISSVISLYGGCLDSLLIVFREPRFGESDL
jgi:hypothetical protein